MQALRDLCCGRHRRVDVTAPLHCERPQWVGFLRPLDRPCTRVCRSHAGRVVRCLGSAQSADRDVVGATDGLVTVEEAAIVPESGITGSAAERVHRTTDEIDGDVVDIDIKGCSDRPQTCDLGGPHRDVAHIDQCRRRGSSRPGCRAIRINLCERQLARSSVRRQGQHRPAPAFHEGSWRLHRQAARRHAGLWRVGRPAVAHEAANRSKVVDLLHPRCQQKATATRLYGNRRLLIGGSGRLPGARPTRCRMSG